jgi:uncharacterized protein YjbJ (UPF0337 family)
MNSDQISGHLKRLRGRVTKVYGRLLGDQLVTTRGSALIVAGTVQVTCGKATREWAHAMRTFETRF